MGAAQKVSEWRKLPLSLTELCIDTTLRCGQSFRWRKIDDEWHCALQGRLVSLKQDSTHLHYRVTWPKTPITTSTLTPPPSILNSPSPSVSNVDPPGDDAAELLHNYFALSHSLSTLYQQWSESDANFASKAPSFTGIRILNQDAWEALVSFICSSNNNISRISQMVHKLCTHYGPYIATVGSEVFHDFPGPEALAGKSVETHLRELGFGYRAKYIAETARIVSTGRPADWLRGLRNPTSPSLTPLQHNPDTIKMETKTVGEGPTYKGAHEALLELSGVGPKVADCVCLMGLGWGEAVPVDTHVWQIAQRDYKFGGKTKTKTFTKAMYDSVGDHFRKIWGPQAGWAQSVLFTANLKSFSEQAVLRGPTKTTQNVKTVKVEVREETEAETQEKTVLEEYGTQTTRNTRKRKTEKVEVKEETETGEKSVLEESGTRTTTKTRKRKISTKTELPVKVEEVGKGTVAEVTVRVTRLSKRRKTQS